MLGVLGVCFVVVVVVVVVVLGGFCLFLFVLFWVFVCLFVFWCVFLPAFTRLGHKCWDLLSPCDGMHVCTD